MPSTPILIAAGIAIGIGIFVLILIRGVQTSPLYNPVTPHSETVEQTDGGWRELVRQRNSRFTKIGVWAIVMLAVMLCGGISLAKPAQKVQAALWPTPTLTASATYTPTLTRTPKPTLIYTLTPRVTASPSSSRTATPATARPTVQIIYQQQYMTKIVSVQVRQTVIVRQTVVVHQTVIVYQTVVVTPTETGTPAAIDTPPTDTETATPTETSLPTETPTP